MAGGESGGLSAELPALVPADGSTIGNQRLLEALAAGGEQTMREADELFPRPKMIVFCAFTFDPEAARDIDQTKGVTTLEAQMNTDLLTEDLKKDRASNQSF